MPATAATPVILSAPRFIVQPIGGGKPSWSFSEMSNITTEVEMNEFIYCDPDGAIHHTKQYGKTKPPSVTLKKPMDTDRSLWAWHMSVQLGNQEARLDCTLQVFLPGSPGMPPTGKPMFQWTMTKAWPSKLDVSGMKAGNSETGVLTVTFACDTIEVLDAKGNATGPAFAS
jgi:phage tail-like protein